MNIVIRIAEVVVVLNAEAMYSEIVWSNYVNSGQLLYILDTRGVLSLDSLIASGLKFEVLGMVS